MTEGTAGWGRHDLEAKIVKRCWEDKAFREEFTTDPAGTAVKYLQVPRGSLPKIVIYEEEPGSWHIVLPAKPPIGDELSEEDLEKVAGGTTPLVTATISLIASGAASLSVSITVTQASGNGGW